MTGKDSQEAAPGEAKIHLLDFWGEYGHVYSAHASPEDARAELAGIARDNWAEDLPGGRPAQEGLSDEEVIEYYFGAKGDPDVGYEIVVLDNPHFPQARRAGKGNG